MLYAMISQPMNGKTKSEILEEKERATKELNAKGYEVINTFFNDEWSNKIAMADLGIVNIPIQFLSRSLNKMSYCNAIYFCKGWENARGCKIEHEVAKQYDMEIFYEE